MATQILTSFEAKLPVAATVITLVSGPGCFSYEQGPLVVWLWFPATLTDPLPYL